MKKIVMIVLCVVIAPPLIAASKGQVASEQKSSDIMLGNQVCKDKLLTAFTSAEELTKDMFVAAPADNNGWVYGRINTVHSISDPTSNQAAISLYAVLVSAAQHGKMFRKDQLRKLPAVL